MLQGWRACRGDSQGQGAGGGAAGALSPGFQKHGDWGRELSIGDKIWETLQEPGLHPPAPGRELDSEASKRESEKGARVTAAGKPGTRRLSQAIGGHGASDER